MLSRADHRHHRPELGRGLLPLAALAVSWIRVLPQAAHTVTCLRVLQLLDLCSGRRQGQILRMQAHQDQILALHLRWVIRICSCSCACSCYGSYFFVFCLLFLLAYLTNLHPLVSLASSNVAYYFIRPSFQFTQYLKVQLGLEAQPLTVECPATHRNLSSWR